jgi:uncharacterized protein
MAADPSMVPDRAERIALPQRLALLAIAAYKVLLSPAFAGSCRYVPSCSDYARDAIVEHGVTRGAWLAVRRLARCHPLGPSGLDPVPARPRNNRR